MGLINWDLEMVLRALRAGVTPPELETANCDPTLLRSARQVISMGSRIREIKVSIEEVDRLILKLQAMQAAQAGVEIIDLEAANWDPEAVKLAREFAELKARVAAFTLNLRGRSDDLEAHIDDLKQQVSKFEVELMYVRCDACNLEQILEEAASVRPDYLRYYH